MLISNALQVLASNPLVVVLGSWDEEIDNYVSNCLVIQALVKGEHIPDSTLDLGVVFSDISPYPSTTFKS